MCQDFERVMNCTYYSYPSTNKKAALRLLEWVKGAFRF